jgi:hypothetical protein
VNAGTPRTDKYADAIRRELNFPKDYRPKPGESADFS